MKFRLALTLIIDALMALVALSAAAAVRFGPGNIFTLAPPNQLMRAAGIFVIIQLFSSYLMDVYAQDRNCSRKEAFINSLHGGAAAFFFLSVVYYLSPGVILGRGVLFLSIVFFMLLQFLRFVFSPSTTHVAQFSRRVLICGTGELARRLGGMITSESTTFTLAGYLTCRETNDNAELLGELLIPMEADLLGTARRVKAGLIVIALSERRGTLPLQEMMRCKLDGIEVVDAPTFYEIIQGKLMLEEMTPSWIIFSSGFRRTAFIDIYKRCFDLTLSLLGLILAAPLFPLVALAIKLESPGPVFFRQVRVGNGERPFVLYKFRSMGQDAEKNGAVWAVKNDVRVTRVGRFLRNSRIDEIPQLFNVLKGEMSFIGPRPERPEFVENLKNEIYYYSKRHTIKPGLTGWAQVRYPYGATVEDAIEKLRYDLYYIKNLSFFLDTQIILETVKVVLFGRGGR